MTTVNTKSATKDRSEHKNGYKAELDKVWKTLRIIQADILQMRSTIDIVERKANRISVAASRSKPDQPEPETRPRTIRRAGDKVR